MNTDKMISLPTSSGCWAKYLVTEGGIESTPEGDPGQKAADAEKAEAQRLAW